MTVTICPNCDNGDPTNDENTPIMKLMRLSPHGNAIIYKCYACCHESSPDDEQWVHETEG